MVAHFHPWSDKKFSGLSCFLLQQSMNYIIKKNTQKIEIFGQLC